LAGATAILLLPTKGRDLNQRRQGVGGALSKLVRVEGPTSIDAGFIPQGSPADSARPVASFSLRNQSGARVTLKTVRRSCSCSDVMIDPEALLPGERATVAVLLRPESPGPRLVDIEIEAADADEHMSRVQLQVGATIGGLAFTPSTLNLPAQVVGEVSDESIRSYGPGVLQSVVFMPRRDSVIQLNVPDELTGYRVDFQYALGPVNATGTAWAQSVSGQLAIREDLQEPRRPRVITVPVTANCDGEHWTSTFTVVVGEVRELLFRPSSVVLRLKSEAAPADQPMCVGTALVQCSRAHTGGIPGDLMASVSCEYITVDAASTGPSTADVHIRYRGPPPQQATTIPIRLHSDEMPECDVTMSVLLIPE
jgi:hypothetical protein